MEIKACPVADNANNIFSFRNVPPCTLHICWRLKHFQCTLPPHAKVSFSSASHPVSRLGFADRAAVGALGTGAALLGVASHPSLAPRGPMVLEILFPTVEPPFVPLVANTGLKPVLFPSSLVPNTRIDCI